MRKLTLKRRSLVISRDDVSMVTPSRIIHTITRWSLVPSHVACVDDSSCVNPMDLREGQDDRKVSETLEVRHLTLIAMATLARVPSCRIPLCFHLLFDPFTGAQALLCGLCIMTPEDPWTFAVSKLLSLREERHPIIEW